jgi:hypothetical protein
VYSGVMTAPNTNHNAVQYSTVLSRNVPHHPVRHVQYSTESNSRHNRMHHGTWYMAQYSQYAQHGAMQESTSRYSASTAQTVSAECSHSIVHFHYTPCPLRLRSGQKPKPDDARTTVTRYSAHGYPSVHARRASAGNASRRPRPRPTCPPAAMDARTHARTHARTQATCMRIAVGGGFRT